MLLVHHLPWYCVVKRSGGSFGYMLWSVLYLIISVTVLRLWYEWLVKTGHMVKWESREQLPMKLPRLQGVTLGPLLLGSADVFMFIACLSAARVAQAREGRGDLESPFLNA